MNTNDLAGSCAECGKPVRLLKGSGRTREYVRGVALPIPDDFLIPTCTSCGETYMTEEISSKLDPILKRQFLKRQGEHFRRLINILILRHGITQREIVRVCGITPSYLSHVLAGKRQASITLTRLLEALVDSSSEFERPGRRLVPDCLQLDLSRSGHRLVVLGRLTITRIAVGTLDHGNLVGGLKAVEDEIAAWLGLDDRSDRITWRRLQQRCKGGSIRIGDTRVPTYQGLRIEVVDLEVGADVVRLVGPSPTLIGEPEEQPRRGRPGVTAGRAKRKAKGETWDPVNAALRGAEGARR